MKRALALAVSLWMSCALADDAAPIVKAPAFRTTDLTALPRAGWLTNGGNLANQRYSPLD
jgi:hypothetical protein